MQPRIRGLITTTLVGISFIAAAATADAIDRARRSGDGDEIAPKKAPVVGTWEVTADEVESARELLTDAAELQSFRADGPLYFVDAHLFRDKAKPARMARVIHYRVEGDLTVYAVVDLDKGEIVDVRSATHVPTPLSQEEFERARGMALADARVAAKLGDAKETVVVEPMLLRTLDRSDPAFGHRVLRLLFRDGRDYRTEPIVYVDLTSDSVTLEAGAPRETLHK